MSTEIMALIFGAASLLALASVILWIGWCERGPDDEPLEQVVEREP